MITKYYYSLAAFFVSRIQDIYPHVFCYRDRSHRVNVYIIKIGDRIMMKKGYLLIEIICISLFCTIGCNRTDSTSDLSTFNQGASENEISEVTEDVESSELSEEGTYLQTKYSCTYAIEEYKDAGCSIISEYDNNGNLAKNSIFNADGELLGCTSEYIYDEEGNVLSYFYSTVDNSITVNNIFEYDEYGNVIVYKNNNSIEETQNFYDDYDNLTKTITIYDNGEYGVSKEVEYDEYGNPLSETRFMYDEVNWINYYENEYDENGNLIKISEYLQEGLDGSKVLESNLLNYYDVNGNLIKTEKYDALEFDGFLVYTEEYEYTTLER